MKTNLFSRLFALCATLILGSTMLFAIDWSGYAWIGNGSGNPTYTDKYKITTCESMTVVNIQHPGFASETGFYMTFAAGGIACSHACDVQGAGIVLHISQFTAQETEVTVTDAAKTYVFTVYYADGTTGPVVADTEAPVMVSASLVSNTHNSAVISVSATDNIGVTKYIVTDATNAFNAEFAASDGKITVTGLAAGTSYNFVITAKDATGNISANSQSVSCTTSTLTYRDFATGHLGNANFGDPNGRILLTIQREDATSVSVSIKPNNAGTIIDYMYVDLNGKALTLGAEDGTSIAGQKVIFSDLGSIASLIFAPIQWHTTSLGKGGRWSVDKIIVAEAELCLPRLTADEPTYFDPQTGGNCSTTADDAFYLTATTEDDGKMIFKLWGVPGNTETVFRNAMKADGFSGAEGITYTTTYSGATCTITPSATIPNGTILTYNSIFEYKTFNVDPATDGNMTDLWPSFKFEYEYGTKSTFTQSTLDAPSITNINAAQVITFSSVPNAANYTVNVKRGGGLVHTQNVNSGDTIHYTPTVTADYTVNLTANSTNIHYLPSESSDYTWHLEAGEIELDPSEYCNYLIGGDANNYAYLTWQTDAEGKVVIGISGYAGDENATFRNNGVGAISDFKVNGNAAGDYFTVEYAGAGATTYTLVPKEDGSSLAVGDKITKTGYIEWITGKNNNAYASFNLEYTYGTDCSSLPSVTVNPASISFEPTEGEQTFSVSGSNLTGDITLSAPKGITLSQTSISPIAGDIAATNITATWDKGTSNGSTIQITGGGLVAAVPVQINVSGFSNHCNRVINQNANGRDWPAYLTVSLNAAKTEMIFNISAGNALEIAKWKGIEKISVNGEAEPYNSKVASKTTSVDGTQITVVFTEALATNDVVKFGSPLVWEIQDSEETTLNGNVYINGWQPDYIVGLDCELESGTPTNVVPVEAAISFYPNPAKEVLTLSNEMSNVSVYSLQGKLLLSKTNVNTMNVSSLAKGMYLIRLTDQNGNNTVEKLEIQ